MPASSLVYPMFAMVVLTLIVLVRLFRSRTRAVREGRLHISFYGIYQGGDEPDYAAKAARHFSNLFEAPTLFYVACLAAIATHVASQGLLVLAWCYVALRVLHACIHLGGNRLRYRIWTYAGSWAVLMVIWVDLVLAVSRRAAIPS
ncbi:MAG TPA: MAPEG family protein [Steroidobacteraceae bacterium]|nr:MAPEG family protein [Steroidobacteraceae bacterium]